METPRGVPTLGALGALRDAIAATSVEAGAERAGDLRARLLAELEGHLIPRVAHPQAPVLVALTGPTGSGKSTLVNSLARKVVSPAGALRPTTRAPILAHRAEDTRWFPGDRRRVPAWNSVHAVVSAHLPAGVALLDTPDVESARSPQHGCTEQLLAVADVWLFVTTATRYADAVPWHAMASASGRQTDLAVVLDRVLPDAAVTISEDLLWMMSNYGLTDAVLLVVPETQQTGGRLPEPAVEPVRSWLQSLSSDGARRAEVLRRTLAGAVAALTDPVAELQRLVGGDARLGAAVAALGGPPETVRPAPMVRT
ncbi:MAG: 50S ribosome-binding GTPase [Actinomycetota bacterium]|nr:50S ribosome-binding GTPase [Actinomycetota bacterium]